MIALAWPRVQAQRSASPNTEAQLAQARADGLARSQALAAEHSIAPADIRLASAHVDALSMAHVRVQQMYQGLPVLGGEAISHFRSDGSSFADTESLVDGISVDPTPSLTSERAAELAIADYGCESCLTDTPRSQLWILRQDGIDHLVYRVQLSRLDGSPASALPVRFIDAHSGSVVLAFDNLQTGTGSSLYSGTVNIGTTFNPSNMQFHMENVALRFGTFNLNGGTDPAAFTRVKDADDTWDAPNKQAGVDAHYAAEKFFAYLSSVHGRNGLDGAGGPRTIAAFNGSGPLFSSLIHYGTAFNDAFWNPIANVVMYGDGDGTTFSAPVSLDLAGHEMTHGLTQFTSGLLFSGESGALSESWSDVLGAMLERNVKGESANTWRIAEDAYTPSTPGDAVRYLDNPHQAVDGGLTADDDPDHYSERYTGAADNGGIHHNSGIANKAFYLVAKGGSHHLGGSMTGIGADDAARIWFLALTSYMTSTTNFVGARQATLDAAVALFGSGSPQHQAVNRAWCLVGVGGCVEAVSITPNSGSGIDQTFTAIFTDQLGVADVRGRIRFASASGTTCIIEYNAATDLVRMQDDTGVWMPGVPFGGGILANSQCILNLASSSAVESGNTLTLNAHFTFTGTFLGPTTISLFARTKLGQSTGWVDRGTWTVGVDLVAGTVTPNSGSGLSQVFTATYSDSAGASDLRARIRFVGASDPGPCVIEYNATTDLVRMQDDTGAWTAPVPLGSGTLGNSQCTLNRALSSAVENGTGLTLSLHITFSGAFVGSKTVSLMARSANGQTTGWVARGTWTVGVVVDAVSVTPDSGNGLEQVFTGVYTNSAGASDLIARIKFVGSNDPGPCVIEYNAVTERVRMQDDTGAWLPALPFGIGQLTNSQCRLDLTDSSAAKNNDTLTLVLHLTFHVDFGGTKTVSLLSKSSATGIAIAWKPLGTWTVPGCSGCLINGYRHKGSILTAGEVDTWTFSATAGDRITVHIGEITDINGVFGPWIRLTAPGGASLGDTSGAGAAVIDDAIAPATGTYTVRVASFNAGFNGTGTYRLSMTHTPAPITVAPGDEGGPLVNGAIQTGTIDRGDVDTWTFTATAGDRIAIHVGEITDTNTVFGPWIRLWSPTGASLGDTAGAAADVIDDVIAPVTGTYLVMVASFNSGFNGTGTYRLTMTKTGAPVTVSPGDEGGPLTNGAMHTGTIDRGDVDTWTFQANAGERIAVHIGEITDTNTVFGPWIRLWSPTGASLGDTAGAAADVIDDVVAPVTGTYIVLVASFNSGFTGTGTYRLTMVHTPGPYTTSPGDEGEPLINGATHTGTIERGDVDVWTFNATAGDRIALHIGEISDTNGVFGPWMRLWSPTGASLGDTAGAAADVIDDVVAPVTGTYTVLVASFNSGFTGTGTYRLTMVHTPGPYTVSPGDDGGPLDDGAMHTGTIVRGDVDVWTFDATAGDRIALHIGEISDTNGVFGPWMRLWSPTGASLGDTAGAAADVIDDVVAPVTGTYTVLVASFNSGFTGTGTYRLTMVHTPGPYTVSPGDDGGPLDNGAMHTGTIERGDVDVWTFTATAGDRIALHIGEVTDTNGVFGPWMRLWSPTGASLGDTAGAAADVIDDVVAPVTGTYTVLVASFNSGFTGTGTYRLTMTHTPGPITVSQGDQGGPLTVGVASTGTIQLGDVDVFTFTATAGDHVTVSIGELVDNGGFAPWIRLWSPTGGTLGDTSGASAAVINNVTVPVSGTYLVLVASFNSGFTGTGTYQVTVTGATGP
jgi:Zn-dependent metalloprotease